MSFPTSSVRAAFIRYSVYRENATPSTIVTETGTLNIVYNQSNPTNNKWEISQDKTGNASITFTVTDAGQVQYTTSAIAGTFVTGKIYFTAQSMLQ